MLERERGRRAAAAGTHPALRPLRDAARGWLPVADRLERAGRADAVERRAALAHFAAAWLDGLDEHFDRCERLLLPVTHEAEVRRRALNEHRLLRAMARDAARVRADRSPDRTWVTNLGERLRQYLRWEEREWFAGIARTVPPDRLAALRDEIREDVASRSDA